MASRKGKAVAAEAAPPEPNLEPDQLRAHDDRGNVRPADDRYLSDDQIEIRDAYVDEQMDDVEKRAQEIAESVRPEILDPLQEELPNE